MVRIIIKYILNGKTEYFVCVRDTDGLDDLTLALYALFVFDPGTKGVRIEEMIIEHGEGE